MFGNCVPRLFVAEYVEELSVKHQMPLILANTAVRGYHLQQPTRRIKGDPAPEIQLPPIFICVSAVPAIF